MKGKLRTSAIGVLAVFALLVFGIFTFFAPQTVYAQLPARYLADVQGEELDRWATDFLKMDIVKDITRGWFESETYDFSSLENDPVVVAIIDSGVNIRHEAFLGGDPQSAGEAGEYDVLYRDDDGEVIGKNVVNGDSNFSDVAPNGHGTHVAGIVATLIHWLDLEKYIKIMPIRAGIADGKGAAFSVYNVKKALEFAISNGADVINMSISENKNSSSFGGLVSDEYASKAIFVAAAGNASTNSAITKSYPAADPNVIGVMNLDLDSEDGGLALSGTSNYGDAYDLCAPGVDIYSADEDANEYVAMSGTSMAAPEVAFAGALALLKYRAIEEATGEAKSVPEVAEILKSASGATVDKGKYVLKTLSMAEIAVGDDELYARIECGKDMLTQTVGQVREIPLSLSVQPASMRGEGRAEWYIDGKKAGDGFLFYFTPENKVGAHTVGAVWTINTDRGEQRFTSEISVTVQYMEVTASNVENLNIGFLQADGSVVETATYEAGKKYTLCLKEIESVDPKIAEKLVWYVDGKRAGVGRTYDLEPSGEGEHEVYVVIGGYTTPSRKVELVQEEQSVNKVIVYVAIAFAAALAIGAVITIAAYATRRKRLR